jgi:hypothetical protein
VKRRRHTPEQIISKLREPDRLLAEGNEVPGSPSNWRSQRRPTTVGAVRRLKADDAKRLKALQSLLEWSDNPTVGEVLAA